MCVTSSHDRLNVWCFLEQTGHVHVVNVDVVGSKATGVFINACLINIAFQLMWRSCFIDWLKGINIL